MMRGSTTPGGMCDMHALMPKTARSRSACICVGECVAAGCLSHDCPAYLFAHSAVDRPVRVRKGREEASNLLYC